MFHRRLTVAHLDIGSGQRIKKQKHYFAYKGPSSQSYGFSSSHVWMLQLNHEHQRIDAFELWYWKRLLRVSWPTRSFNQSLLKEISPEYLLEGSMLKLKPQHFGHLINRLIRKDPNAEKDWRQEERRMTEDKTAGWHHRSDGHEFEQVLGGGDGQGSLVCCSPWDHKESAMTEWLNWTE